jgi:uncharacterized protein YfaS (alpha-2-macroglobulin family)
MTITVRRITVTTDPNTHVDLLDKDGNIIGSGTTDSNGHVTIGGVVSVAFFG